MFNIIKIEISNYYKQKFIASINLFKISLIKKFVQKLILNKYKSNKKYVIIWNQKELS